jgi:ATP/maltotriose-dependent transcriptional regulator MalT
LTINAGRAALLRGAWSEARAEFAGALAVEESPDAYEGLGIAARYQSDLAAAVEAHERGYRLARRRGEPEAAARLAAQLALDAYGLGRIAESSGWIERALELTEVIEGSEARALAMAMRAHAAMLVRNDPDEAQALLVEVLELARAAGSTDIETAATALEGLVLVSSGDVATGMRKLDAATAAAVAGDVADVDIAETICCYLIDACKRVRDLERAAEWCERVQEIATRFDDRFMFAVCRIHHADVLVWRGAWADAADTLRSAEGALREVGSGRVADITVRLAELRRRQGRRDEARALLAECEAHRLHPLHLGQLDLDAGDAESAADEAARFLRRVGSRDRFERVGGLELLVRAALALGDSATAEEAAAELRASAGIIGTGPLRAASLLADGRLAAAAADHAAARALLEDAIDAFEVSGAPYEAAQARLELAAALRELGRSHPAQEAETKARETLAALGATNRTMQNQPGLLTRREREVLSLVAQGRSNDQIAASLVLSVRTVERHVANAYAKIGVSGRTARAAAASWAHTHGVT